jgi:hypothetical protein
LKAGIGYCPNGYANHGRLLTQLDVNRGTACGTEEGLDDIAFRRAAFEALGFTLNGHFAGSVVGDNAEWRAAAALAGNAMASRDESRPTGQIRRKSSTLTLRLHGRLPLPYAIILGSGPPFVNDVTINRA